MNHVQRPLPESELTMDSVQDVLRCLLHTIIFARWPNEVKPHENQCKYFPVAYTSCGDRNVDNRINSTIIEFMETLYDAGPDLQKGTISITFFKKRINKVAFWQYQEKVVWEEWIIPLLINNSQQPRNNERISQNERNILQIDSDLRYLEILQSRMFEIITLLNESVDHVPPTSDGSHEFEFSFAQSRNNLATEPGYRQRVMSAPPVSV
mmetsp:Transcript_6844/g.8828  ORF Transcript_6844/g.8828 Transcript_6844/m.8828 type:complete len:209 (-) Transcript_6844:191-817(-)